jgi:hypothetical protein
MDAKHLFVAPAAGQINAGYFRQIIFPLNHFNPEKAFRRLFEQIFHLCVNHHLQATTSSIKMELFIILCDKG